MSAEEYWNVKMMQYIERFARFRQWIITKTGITDEEAIQEHWELFADNFCGCESCEESDEDVELEITIPSFTHFKLAQPEDETDVDDFDTSDEDWDDETPDWTV